LRLFTVLTATVVPDWTLHRAPGLAAELQMSFTAITMTLSLTHTHQ
jgi:hypothetical protein